MKKITILLGGLFLIPFTGTMAQGDNCATAVVLTGSGNYTADGPSTGAGCFNCGTAANADWYSFTAPSNGTLDISVCADPADVDTRLWVYSGTCGTLVQVGADDDGCTGTFESVVTGIVVSTGITYYLEWDDRWSASGFDFDFTFNAISCPVPTALFANSMATQADLGWTENGSAISWQIEWGAGGFTPGAGTTVITGTNPHTLMGLTANTSYDYYVRAICGAADTSAWSVMMNFMTPCTATIAPYSESFDGATTPACWLQSATTGGPWEFGALGAAGWAAAAFDDNTGNAGNFAWIDFSGSNDVGVILEMPIVDVSAFATTDLTFWLASYNTDDNDSNILYVEAWDGATWASVATIQQDSSLWVEHTYDITGNTYGAGLVRIRYRAEQDPVGVSFFTNDLLIDDVLIDGTVGIDDYTSGNINMTVSPNPNKGLFTLNINTTDVSTLDIKIVNLQGQVVFAKNNFDNVSNVNEQIDLSNNAKGIYFIAVTSDKGVQTQKVIVQ